MNRQQLIEKLMRLLLDFRRHPRFLAELVKLIVGSGQELRILTQLEIRLHTLADYPTSAFLRDRGFEHLEDGIYSMHVDVQRYNLRILYYVDADGAPCLLLPFFERGGKNATDYSKKIPAARAMRSEMEGR